MKHLKRWWNGFCFIMFCTLFFSFILAPFAALMYYDYRDFAGIYVLTLLLTFTSYSMGFMFEDEA